MDKRPVVIGEVLFDCFEDGSRVLGGAPFNVAWHLQAFGFDPLFVSRVGDDALGREIRETMGRWSMSTDGLQVDRAHPTGEVQVSLEHGQPSFEIVADRAYDHISGTAIPEVMPKLVYHGSLGLRHSDSAHALETLLDRHPAPVFLDVNLRPPWWHKEQITRLLDHTRWLKINDVELEALTGHAGELEGNARALINRHNLSLIIVTLGEQGAFAVNKQGEIASIAPAGQTVVVDTVGAGDAFASICIIGLLQNWQLSLTMERAQLFASLVVGQRGATADNPKLYRHLIDQWQL